MSKRYSSIRKANKRRSLARPLVAAAVLGLLLVAGLAWYARRQPALPVTSTAPSADPQEARLLQAVQSRPRDPKAREALAHYYLAGGQPLPALGELAVARELGASARTVSPRVAEALRAAGLPGAALRVLEEASPATGPDLLARARLHLDMAEPEAALSLLRQNPAAAASPEGALLLAQAAWAADDLPAARAAVRRYRQHPEASRDAETGVALGRLALAMGDHTQAREWLAETAREHPGDEPAQYTAGTAYANSASAADQAAAIEYFKAATRADPLKARAGIMLARLLYEKAGQWERAVPVYRQALKLEPQSVEAEAGLARAFLALKQPGQALYHQARIRELEERSHEALPLYRRWGQQNPKRWDSVLRAAECWMDRQRFVEAAREVRRGLERFPDHPELFGHLAQLYLRTGDRPEAARLCERWAPLDTDTGRPEWVRAQLAAQAQRGDEAVRWFQAAVDKNPRMGVYRTDLAKELARSPTPERLRQARSALEQASELTPSDAQPQTQLGLVLQAQDDPEGARRAFLRALDRDPARLDAYRGLMAVTRQLGHPKEAGFFAGLEREARDWARSEAAARRRVAAGPTDAPARLDLARLLLRRGRLPEARRHLAVAAAPPAGAPARPLLRRVERLLEVRG